MLGNDEHQPQSGLGAGKIVLLLLLATVLVWLVFTVVRSPDSDSDALPFSQVIRDARAGRIDTIEVSGESLSVTYLPVEAGDDPITRDSRLASGVDLPQLLVQEGVALGRTSSEPGVAAVNLEYRETTNFGAWLGVIFSVLPLLLIGVFIWWMIRQSRNMGSQALGFTKSHARPFTGSTVAVTFDDVAGADEAKQELVEVVQFLRTPERFARLGAHIPRGLLLVGPPGTGKTLLARAVAGEANVPFFSISGSEFVELYVGVGASRVRDLFEKAKHDAPCIIFLDELDAVGRQRGAGLGGGSDEREQTLNQILVAMDGFEPETNVIVIAATNRPDILDPALLRPGRFDRKVVLDIPDVAGRRAILDVHIRGKPLAEDVPIDVLARTTPGFSGADLANLVNEAAILAARGGKSEIGMDEFEEAVDRVIAGPARKSRVMTERERRITAYHEGGHAVVAHFLEHHDVPQKVTIVSHGTAGGYTRFLPEEEHHYLTPDMFRDQICAGLAGHAAEQMVFGQASTGPINDLEQVTRLARSMVMRWGMSEKLGPRTFGRTEELVFLGREISETRDYSEEVATMIDAEIHRLLDEGHERAKQILSGHRALLDKLVSVLLEVETLGGSDLRRLLDQDPSVPWEADQPASSEPEPPAVPAPARGLEWPERAGRQQ